jgi:hypothetical protein
LEFDGPLRPERQEPELMKEQLSALSLLLLFFTARQASPENMKTEEAASLPGITFTRSLNQAAAHAKVDDGRITLASEARRDNFRDRMGSCPITRRHCS